MRYSDKVLFFILLHASLLSAQNRTHLNFDRD